MAKYAQKYAISKKRGYCHQVWVKNLLSRRRTLIEGLELAHGKSNIHRLRIRRLKKRKTKSKSMNDRSSANKMREKFGVVVPNTVKEALLLDKMNGDSKWCDATKKEMMALEKLIAWTFHPPGHCMGSEFKRYH